MDFECDVEMLYDCLDGHEMDTKVKIKLHDGTVLDIAGFKYINSICGGDDIIYIAEVNPLKKEWGEAITDFVRFANKIMDVCESEYGILSRNDDNYDPCDILHIENEIAKLADFYIKKCKLEKYVEERYGYYEEGAGDTDEICIKIGVLKDFINL